MATSAQRAAPAPGLDLPAWTIAQAARLLSRGELSAVELAEAALRRIPPETHRLVEMLLERAGLILPEALVLQLCEAAPYALAMAQRIPALDWEAEPMNIYACPQSLRAAPDRPAR